MIKWPIFVAAACLAFYSETAVAAGLLDLSKKNLGVPWNAQPQKLAREFPGLKESSPGTLTYQGTFRIGALAYPQTDVLLLFDESIGGLNRLYTTLPNTDADQVVSTLQNKLGAPRWASYPDRRFFQHVYEWSNARYTIQFAYVAQSADALSKPATQSVARLEVSRDRPRVSRVDQALKYQALQKKSAASAPQTAVREQHPEP